MPSPPEAMGALSETPLAETLSLKPMEAELIDLGTLIARPMPTPIFDGAAARLVADPSAEAVASVSAAAVSVNAPPAVIVRLSPTFAVDSLSEMLTAIAPAKLTVVPELSFAAGADFPPVVPFEPVAAA